MLDKLPFSLNTSAGAYPTADLLIFGSDYGHADFVTPMARFAFCKRDETLINANKALKAGALKYAQKMEALESVNAIKSML